MLSNWRRIVFGLSCAIAFAPWLRAPLSTAGPQVGSKEPIQTTITTLVESSAKFRGKRVRILASFQSDGIERSILMEPNCGEPRPVPQTPGKKAPQCHRGVTPKESEKAADDPGNRELDHALAQGDRSTMDKHITAEFTGIFSCEPSCASPKLLTLAIERVENVKIETRDLKPHPPK